ncbi:MAG: phosphatase PAP2 family protein [Bacteroidales bacterium]|nr:phosphatase PAP2 family protein [Bacteroidales bacterium]
METLKALDLNIFFWINGHHTPFLDTVMYLMTRPDFWVPFFAVVVFLIFRHYRKQAWWIMLCFCLSILVTDRTSVMIKNAVQRPRPTHNVELQESVHVHTFANGKEYRGGHYSFPSSHAANSFGCVVLLIYFFRRITRHAWWIFPLWALVFCYTRVYLGVHYPSDICCGSLLGLLCGSIVLLLYRFWVRKRPFSNENQKITT